MKSAIHANDCTYSGNVATASPPMANCTYASVRTDDTSESLRRRMASAPSDKPRMNADSISSNECVADPSTSDSIRIQPIS